MFETIILVKIMYTNKNKKNQTNIMVRQNMLLFLLRVWNYNRFDDFMYIQTHFIWLKPYI
jgi:hypothetical protein